MGRQTHTGQTRTQTNNPSTTVIKQKQRSYEEGDALVV